METTALSKSILLLIILGSLVTSALCFLKTYKEACEADCDESQGLFCNDKARCSCMGGNSTVFDKKINRCVGRAGKSCVMYGRTAFCVQNAECKAGTCACESGFFGNLKGICSPTAKYQERCGKRRQCEKSKGQVCDVSTRTCQCEFPEAQRYLQDERKCISLAENHCDSSDLCVKNSICVPSSFEEREGIDTYGRSYKYNYTTDKVCRCKKGYSVTSSFECSVTFGGPCSSTATCNVDEGLKCIDLQECGCRNPLNEIYDTEMGRCIVLSGGQCNHNEEVTCGPNSACTAGICSCVTGYQSSTERRCLKRYGERCDGANQCDNTSGLHCDSGTCKCIDSGLHYSKEDGKCLQTKQGTPCGSLNVFGSSNYIVHCGGSMSCKEIENPGATCQL